MVQRKLTKRVIDALLPQESTYTVWDAKITTFGVRVFKSGHKSFVLKAFFHGRQKWATLGEFGPLTVEAARALAEEKRGDMTKGIDPTQDKRDERESQTVKAAIKQFTEEHVEINLKPRTQKEYKRLLNQFIIPSIGNEKIKNITRDHIIKITISNKDTPTQANRILSVLSKLFNLAEKWNFRPTNSNPCRHIEKTSEEKRKRYLSDDEIMRLSSVLDKFGNKSKLAKNAANATKLLLFTGARLSEILELKWEYIRNDKNLILLPDSKTGQKTIFMNESTKRVLDSIEKIKNNPYVICGEKENSHLVNLEKPWRVIRKEANLNDVRLHDLRHTFASLCINSGASLPMVGALLGHTQVSTTQRYAHLTESKLQEFNNEVGIAMENMFKQTK